MVTSIIDTLNLRDYILLVVEFIKKWGSPKASPRTTLSFLKDLFSGADFRYLYKDGAPPNKTAEKSVDDFADTIQRMFTGNVHYSRLNALSNDIVSGTYDKLLLSNLDAICKSIDSTSHPEYLYSHIMRLVSCRFFSDSEKNDIKVFYEEGLHNYLHLVIVKHAFASLYNIPCFFAERIYQDALTYDFDSPLRFSLLKVSADYGNKVASLEYGNYLAKTPNAARQVYKIPRNVTAWMKSMAEEMEACPLKKQIKLVISGELLSESPTDEADDLDNTSTPNYPEAFKYLLAAFPLPAAIWNAAFLLEQHFLGNEQEEELRSALRIQEKIDASEFNNVRDELSSVIYTGGIPEEASTMLFLYSVYFYLAYRGFSKAFNSMAKLLHTGTVSVYSAVSSHTTENLKEKYWAYGIRGGNPTAIANYGNKLLRDIEDSHTFDPDSEKTHLTEELLTVAASLDFMRANYGLGRFYEYAGKYVDHPFKTPSGILEIYKYAAKLDRDGDGVGGDLYFRMAALTNDQRKKKEYYQKALTAGKYDASYHLALLIFREYQATGRRELLLGANEYLINHRSFISSEIKPLADLLSQTINNEVMRLGNGVNNDADDEK